jgi:hypothetical protein
MVYFLRPSSSFSYGYGFDPLDKTNLSIAIAAFVAVVVIVVIVVQFKRPTAMGLCDKDKKDDKGKCKVNWGRTSLVSLGAGIIGAGIAMGVLYGIDKSKQGSAVAVSSAEPASPSLSA